MVGVIALVVVAVCSACANCKLEGSAWRVQAALSSMGICMGIYTYIRACPDCAGVIGINRCIAVCT